MTRQALLHLGIPSSEIQREAEARRNEVFGPFLSTSEDYKTLGQFRSAEQHFDLQWASLDPQSKLVGVTIGEAGVRKQTGAAVVGVIREDRLVANPDANFCFAAGDRIAIIGTDDARRRFGEVSGARI